MGLVNPLDVAQSARIELLPEGMPAVALTVSIPAKRRVGFDLTPSLPANSAFGTLVHFDRQGIASLTLRRVSDFFGPSAITIPGTVFCRQEAP